MSKLKHLFKNRFFTSLTAGSGELVYISQFRGFEHGNMKDFSELIIVNTSK